jgi:hypothetical protein
MEDGKHKMPESLSPFVFRLEFDRLTPPENHVKSHASLHQRSAPLAQVDRATDS